MSYVEFLGLSRFVLKRRRTSIVFVEFHYMSCIQKYYRKSYYQLIRLTNFLVFFKIYRFNESISFAAFWKYLQTSSQGKLLYFLKVYQKCTIFFFSYRVRNLFCIVWQGRNIETFFSSYLCANRRSRGNFLPQLKIIRYVIYLYFQDVTTSVKLQFSRFSSKIKYIIKLFFYWLTFYTKMMLTKKTFFLHYIMIDHKFPRGRVKKKMYPTKKRYLQRKSNFRLILK